MLFLLDEPASNLHSKAQEKIVEVLGKVTNNASVIYSTHSLYLLDVKYFNNMYVIYNETKKEIGETCIQAKKYTHFSSITNKKRDSYYQPVLDHLKFVYPQIDLKNHSIFVEGKTDWYTLAVFQKLLRESNSKELYSFYPMTGSGTMGFAISMVLGTNIKFVVLLDSDKAGKGAKDIYQKNYGDAVGSRR